jgi:phospholipid transport system substrate-binding protein
MCELGALYMKFFQLNRRLKMAIAMFLVLSFVLPTTAHAEVTPPDVVIKTTLENALKQLRERRDEFSADNAKLNQAIENTLGPAINFELFSKGVLGNHWRKASTQQRADFVGEFKRLLIGTYASAVFDYSGEKINYLPFSNPKKADRVKVKTEFVSKNGSKIPMVFSMNIRGDSQWKVYNIKIQAPEATIELIPLYRSDFRDRVSSQGLDKLIAEMKAKNNR